jgi:hypothetical protein
VIDLRYQSGMSVEGVADSFGRTTRTIHRTFARIRRLLHQCITATIRSTPGLGA